MSIDIAIIGMAARFPDANNLDELYENLINKIDSVRSISKKRLEDTALSSDGEYMVCGYLDDIDKFDHDFFNISRGEAQTMGPDQRLLLEVAYETFDNSGYSIDYFNGSNTSIFVGVAESDYYKHAEEFTPTLITGNDSSYLAAKLARYFNLTGNAAMINTACSSSLVAVHMACNELILGNSDYSLVCGVNLYVFPYMNKTILDMFSPDGKSRAFSANADGMSRGEVVASILLKPLDKAIKDNDIIHAVIKSSAVNNNASRSPSPTAPDSITQAEVIKSAWRKAGIVPEKIGFIEAHGSGTQLGDTLEVEGLNLAFAEYTDKKEICSISTIKSNCGHGMSAAGLAGLVKAVLSLKKKVIFPSIHINPPNPLIDFDHSSVKISDKNKKWDIEENEVRYAGVTSIGASGINCHLVLQEAPNSKPTRIETFNNAESINSNFLFTFSGKTQSSLVNNISTIYKKLNDYEYSLSDISFTLNTGRKHYNYRYAIIAKNKESLLDELHKRLTKDFISHRRPAFKKMILMFSDYIDNNTKLFNFFLSNYSVFKKCVAECEKYNIKDDKRFTSFAFQYSLYKLFESYGIKTSNILGIGVGEIVCRVLANELTLKEGLERADKYIFEEDEDLNKRIELLVERESKCDNVELIEIGPRNLLSNKILHISEHQPNIGIHFLADDIENKDVLLEIIKELYLANCDIDFVQFQENYEGKKVELPAYQFDKIRCWLRDEPIKETVNVQKLFNNEAQQVIEKNISEIEMLIAKCWFEVLQITKLSIRDDFFKIGGDSLKATQIILKLSNDFGIDLSFEDIFDCPTVECLAEFVSSKIGKEQKIVMFWKEILKIEKVDSDDNFFDQGGHSLLASQLLNRINREFKISLSFEDIFEFPTLGQLVLLVEKRLIEIESIKEIPSKNLFLDIKPVKQQDNYELSSAQKRIFILSQIEDKGISYNVPGALIIKGDLDKEKLLYAIEQLVLRQESLRTSFEMLDKNPIQKVNKDVNFSIYEFVANENKVRDIIREFMKPFNLEELPLLRVGLIRLSEKKHVLIFDIHHIISDGSSLGILMREFMQLYCGRQLPELRLQYKDYSGWQNKLCKSNEYVNQEKYWLNSFKGDIPVLNLPADFPRPNIQSFEGSSINFELGSETLKKLKSIAAENGATLFMVLISAYYILLSKYSGQDDIVVGTPIAGRPHPDFENVVGMFVNTLAMRNYPFSEKTFRAFLHEVKENSLKAFENQYYQFEDLVEKLGIRRSADRNPIFDTMFALQNMEGSSDEFAGLKIEPYNFSEDTVKFDITLDAIENTRGIIFITKYSTRLFKRETIEKFILHYANILEYVSNNIDAKISDIELLSDSEKNMLLFGFNNTDVGYENLLPIVKLIEEQVEKTPDNIAVSFLDMNLTYKELNKKSNELAHILIGKGIGKGNYVPVLMERGIDLVISLLAIMKTGAAFSPIDINWPIERIKITINELEAQFILVDQNTFFIEAMFDKELITVNSELIGGIIENPAIEVGIDDVIYAIFTSGSTGKPKGVIVPHLGLTNRFLWMNDYIGRQAAVAALLTTNHVYDSSVWQIFWPLINGGKTVIPKPDVILTAQYLVEIINSNAISITDFVPSVFNIIVNELEEDISLHGRLDSLKCIVIGGEEITPSSVYKFRGKFPHTKLLNLYGPTEASIGCVCYEINGNEGASIPIGRPISNTKILILDKNRKLVPIGVDGEIYITGKCLGHGYLKDREKTEAVFVDNPYKDLGYNKLYKTGDLARYLPNGNIVFLGRMDFQVKIRGFRIELGEIEARMLKHAEIKEAVVVSKESSNHSKYLCAYYVSKRDLEPNALKKFLSIELPEYMIPSCFMKLSELPLTNSGKINREALPDCDINLYTSTEYVAPTTKAEEILSAIWSEVLGMEKVGVNNNYFDLGGDSIKAIQISARLRKHGLKMEVRELFSNPTIGELAKCLKDIKRTINQEAVVGEIKLSPIQKRFFDNKYTELNYNNQAVMLYNKNGFDEDCVRQAFEGIVTHHDILRAVYRFEENSIIQYNRGLDGEFFILDVVHFYDNNNLSELITETANRMQEGLKIDNGPLIRLGLFKTSEGDHLLIVIHHLLIDGVSWRIILEDFGHGYKMTVQNETIRLQDKTDSYKDWAEKIVEYSKSNDLMKEVKYWSGFKDYRIKKLPVDNVIAENRYIDSRDYTITLSEKDTNDLLRNANKAYNTEIQDLLLTALGLIVKEWNGDDNVLLNLEGYGREELIGDLNVVRTVGWFTSIYPIILVMKKSKDISYQIRAVKETIRHIPNKGFGYGILKYITSNITDKLLPNNLEPEICFNYFGQFDSDISNTEFQISSYSVGSCVSPNSERRYKLEISGFIINNKLSVTVNYNRFEYNIDTVKGLLEGFKNNLLEIIRHCIGKTDTEITPDDLENKNITIEDLDEIKNLLSSL